MVLPEAVWTIDGDDRLKPFAGLGAPVVVGAIRVDQNGSVNAAVIHADGPPVEYHKQHLLPGLESAHRPGRDLVLLPGEPTVGVAICKDLDFPALARAYRRAGRRRCSCRRGTSPATGGCTAGWPCCAASRRAGRRPGGARGRATVSDATGRVLAETDTMAGAVLDAELPLDAAPTPYARWGDWFGWACVAATVALMVAA
ncbi:hypothetical protein ACFQX7_26190 [Luedemannella flava]